MTTDPQLAEMISGLRDVPEIYRSSPFWEQLAAAGIEQLEAMGFEHFKRTVNARYFNWRLLSIMRHQFLAVGAAWLVQPGTSIFQARFPQSRAAIADRPASFNGLTAWAYKTYVAMYADVVARQNTRGLLRIVEEPSLGNPFLVRHNGLNVSQDLCNSVHELYSILGPDGLPPAATPPTSFAEVSSGYGRLAYVILKAVPSATYCIIDIPPALYLSQRYLTTLFPELPAFRFRLFREYAEVADQFKSSRTASSRRISSNYCQPSPSITSSTSVPFTR